MDTEVEMAKILNKYFIYVFMKEEVMSAPTIEEKVNMEVLENVEITQEKVAKAIEKMKNNKAAEVDDLVSTFIKGSAAGLVSALSTIIHKSV